MCVYTIMFLKTNLNKHSFMIYISGPKNICKIYIFRGGEGMVSASSPSCTYTGTESAGLPLELWLWRS